MRKLKTRYHGFILMQAIDHINLGRHPLPLAYKQARVGMVNMARFHAKFWCGDDPSALTRNFPELAKIRTVTSRETGRTTKYMIETDGYKDMVEIPEYAVVSNMVSMLRHRTLSLKRLLRRGPFTVSHGDTKSDNFFFEVRVCEARSEANSR